MVIDPNASFSITRHGVSRNNNSKNNRANPGVKSSSSAWADQLTVPKPEQVFRYIFHNIQGLPVHPHGHKHQQIVDAFQETEADMFGMVELNLNFNVMDASGQRQPRNSWIHPPASETK